MESLQHTLAQFQMHYHEERPHQGKDKVILYPSSGEDNIADPIRCRERLGGILKYYHREAGEFLDHTRLSITAPPA